MHRISTLLAVTIVSLAISPALRAQSFGQQDEPAWELPTNAMQWLNSPPLSAEALAGKGVVLYFFEEECPRCAENWPRLKSLAQEYADKPVVFLAVNSGTPPPKVQAYARKYKVSWPLILDFDRSLESQMNVNPISLSNIVDIKTVSAEGVLGDGSWGQLRPTIDRVLQGAAWRVEPQLVPTELRDAWYWIEIGAYNKAAKDVTRAASRRGSPLQEGAEALLAAVEAEIITDREKAVTAFEQGEVWESYKRLEQMSKKYDGYEQHAAIAKKQKELAKHEDVVDELRAKQTLDKAFQTASRGNAGSIRRAVGMLDKLVANDPETEAAQSAREILARFNARQ